MQQRFFKTMLLAIAMLSCNATLQSQSAPIAIDDDFSDWTSGLSSFQDANDVSSGLDLLDLQVTNDEHYLFIKIRVNNEIDLTDDLFQQNIVLYIDTDNNENTGYDAQELYGAELLINLKNRTARFEGVSPPQDIYLEDLKLRHAPTVTGDEFEIAIARDVTPVGNIPLFPGETIKILFRNSGSGDAMPDEGQSFSYTFDETPVPPYIPVDLHKAADHYLRVVAYNTEHDGLTESWRQDNFENVLKALNPDIIGFSEAADTDASLVKSLLDDWLPLETTEGWFVEKDDYDMITASRWEIVSTWPQVHRQFPVLIDLSDSYGKDFLFTNAHYNCCDNDAGRQDQADAYIAFIKDAKTPGGDVDLDPMTPFLLAGDLNLVGYAQQLNTLVTGDIQNTIAYGIPAAPDWDDTDCTDQICLHADQRMAFTWPGLTSSFPPGRLDFQIYSDAAMTAMKSFSLYTAIMSPERLAEYNLNAWDTDDASDHLPVVVDYLLDTQTQTDYVQQANPFRLATDPDQNGFYLLGEGNGSVQVKVFDASGKCIVIESAQLEAQNFISSAGWGSGIYIFVINTPDGEFVLRGVKG